MLLRPCPLISYRKFLVSQSSISDSYAPRSAKIQSWATRLPTKRGRKPKVALMLVENQYVGESRKIVMETWLAETIVGLINDYVAIKVAEKKRAEKA